MGQEIIQDKTAWELAPLVGDRARHPGTAPVRRDWAKSECRSDRNECNICFLIAQFSEDFADNFMLLLKCAVTVE